MGQLQECLDVPMGGDSKCSAQAISQRIAPSNSNCSTTAVRGKVDPCGKMEA